MSADDESADNVGETSAQMTAAPESVTQSTTDDQDEVHGTVVPPSFPRIMRRRIRPRIAKIPMPSSALEERPRRSQTASAHAYHHDRARHHCDPNRRIVPVCQWEHIGNASRGRNERLPIQRLSREFGAQPAHHRSGRCENIPGIACHRHVR